MTNAQRELEEDGDEGEEGDGDLIEIGEGDLIEECEEEGGCDGGEGEGDEEADEEEAGEDEELPDDMYGTICNKDVDCHGA